ncbi:MAG: hypothetical protein K2X36_03495 [Microbacteriaceae bacterium]|nr:hypothetical protein [Microbacteriaceae bacterium]
MGIARHLDKAALIFAALVSFGGSASAQLAEDYRIQHQDWAVVVLKEVFGDKRSAFAESPLTRTIQGRLGAQAVIVCFSATPMLGLEWPVELIGPTVSMNVRMGSEPVQNLTFMPLQVDLAANRTLPRMATLIPWSTGDLEKVSGVAGHTTFAFGPAAYEPLDAAVISLRGFSSAMADMTKACAGTMPAR